MEWLERMNDALAYIEGRLTGGIALEEAARLACCSNYHFQRMFSYMAGVPLAEYVRRRRMTLAAFDLQRGDKVIDVALRYGYESPTSFNRAFQGVHGIPPSAAQREGAQLRAYPRIGFQLIIRGVTSMEYRIEKREAFRVVGVADPMKMDFEESFARTPVFWEETVRSGKIPQILALMEGEPQGLLGVSTCNGPEEQNYYFICVASGKQAPAGMGEYTVPACTWAIFPGQGTMPGDMQELQKRIVAEWLPASGYEWGNAPDVEVYLNADPAAAQFEVWLPVVKKQAPGK